MLATIILDFGGGTYVSQVEVRNLRMISSAIDRAFDWRTVAPRVKSSAVAEFVQWIGEQAPAPLDGLDGVWCLSGILGDSLALINVVDTAVQGGRGKGGKRYQRRKKRGSRRRD